MDTILPRAIEVFILENFSTVFPPKFYKLYKICKKHKKYKIFKSIDFIVFYKLYKIYKNCKILYVTPLQGEGQKFESSSAHHLIKSRKALF